MTILIVVGCGSRGDAIPDAMPDVAVDAVISPDPEPDPAVTACTSTLALPTLPAIAQVRPKALAVADFNEDGKPDFVVVQGAPASANGAVITYTGDGSGGFTASSTATVVPSVAITKGDLDGDGHIDVAVVAASYTSSPVLTVLRGVGDGTFAAPLTYPIPAGSEDVTLADLNGDNRLDAIVSSSSTGISLLRGNGDGTLQARVDLVLPSVKHVVAARLDADTDLDLAVTLTSTSVVRVLPGNGDGTFGTAADVSVGYQVDGIAAGDFDEDGDVDLVTAHDRALPATGDAYLLLNDGTGAFAPGTAAFPMPFGDAFALDVDGDANLDIVSILGVQYGAGDGSFPQQTILGTWLSGITSIAVGSFDSDSRTDFLVTRENDGLVSFVRGASTTSLVADVYSGQAGTPSGIAIADFNGDTRPDFATLNHYLNPALEPGNIAVFLGNAAGFDEPQLHPTGYAAMSLLVTDFNQDGRPDLAASHGPFGFGPGVTVLINTGSSFARTDYADPMVTNSAVAGDFDRDGHLDIVRSSGTRLVVMHGAGDGTFTDTVTSELGADNVVAGDFDDDGDLDLVTLTSDIKIAFNNGDGTFVSGPTLKVATGRTRAAVGDLDQDGDEDIVVRTASRLLAFRSSGSGSFEEVAPIELEPGATSGGEVPSSLQLADMDGDGHKDIVTAFTQRAALAVLRGRGDSTFQAPLLYPAAGQFARAGHLDSNQHLDVISAGGGGVIRILTNTCSP